MTTEDPKALTAELQIARLQSIIQQLQSVFPALKDLTKGSAELQEHVINEITAYALSVQTSKLDRDQLATFFKHPYHIYKERRDKENDWHIAIPKFIDVQLGWLERVTDSHNVFLINRYVDWLGELPDALKQKVGMKDPLDVYLDGDLLVGRDVEKAKDRYKPFIKGKDREGRGFVVDKSKHFELLATLIKDGILPFVPRPIPKDLLVEGRKCDFQLRDYQQEGWKELQKYSNVGAFFPPSTGKTFFGMWCATHIKPPHLIAVPSNLLVQQWEDRIELYTDLKLKDEVDVMTYQMAIKKGHLKKYTSKIIDEVHHLPADQFSYLSVINTPITVGLSATPQREDGREEYIFALTGRPVGLAWDVFKRLGIIQSPTMHVMIVKSEDARLQALADLIADDKKTIIFCDSLDMGAKIAKRFAIPHIYGETKDKYQKAKDAPISVISRVGDEGLSLPDIQRVIEVSWLFGSRRQELQRFTRLLHGRGTEGEGFIIMTVEEYDRDHKRLFSIMDRGFKIVLHRDGLEDKIFGGGGQHDDRDRKPRQASVRRPAPVRASNSQPLPADLDDQKYPLLKYAGIKKIVAGLGKPQRKVMLFLIDPQNQNQTFTAKKLMLALGYTGDRRFRITMSPLVSEGFVLRQADGTYRQNFSDMVK